MKKFLYALSLISLICMIYICPVKYLYAEENHNDFSSTSSSSGGANNSWEIIIDEKKDSNEFESIQNDISSSDLGDNGYFLLLIGTILIIFPILGTIYFSIQLYKTFKLEQHKSANSPHKSPRYVGQRYK